MATKYLENVGGAAGEAATELARLKGETAANVVPVIGDAIDGVLKYYDRVNSVVRQVGGLNPAPISAAAASLAITNALHVGRTIVLNRAAGTAVQMPLATGSGDKYRFVVGTAGNANVVSAVVATDIFAGGYIQNDSGGSAAVTADFMEAAATDNTYSPTTAGGGGLVGDWFEVQDIAANTWAWTGMNKGTIDPTNRFSHV